MPARAAASLMAAALSGAEHTVPLLPDTLSAGSLGLHRWRPTHRDGMLAAVEASFPELHQWMPWAATMPTADEMTKVLQEGEAAFDDDREWSYTLIESDSGEVVGSAGLHRRAGPGTIEIGYWVRSDRTGRGYATAAARVLTDAAFTWLDQVEQVEIRMDRANRASASVPPKLGFRLLERENRERLAPAHSGGGLVWTRDRPSSGHD